MGNSSGVISYCANFQLMLQKMPMLTLNLLLQVEVSGGRGKPSSTVDKDDGLQKVSTIGGHGINLCFF